MCKNSNILFLFLWLFLFLETTAQNSIQATVLDYNSKNPLQNALVYVLNSQIKIQTNSNGIFKINNLKKGPFILEIKLLGYQIQKIPITINNSSIDLGIIFLTKIFIEQPDLSIISITDDELNNDANSADNISGLLQATKDVFLRAAAFQFSASFFRLKGLGSEHGKVLMNGIELNKVLDGRAQWSNWGGLNDVLREQEFSNGLAISNVAFGGVLGSTNFNTRASKQRPGSRISYSSSNRSYQHRVMATHTMPVTRKGWSFTFSGSRRLGNEGFNDATSYNATSFFTAIEKKISKNHQINFTGIFAQNRRGKSSPNTQEVVDLKGIKYNEYWGRLNGRKLNSRLKDVEEPIIMLNHFWTISDKNKLQTNVSYQFGSIGNSRLDFNGGANPSPTYYQKLPSYFLANSNFFGAYSVQKQFLEKGQLDWGAIFDANITNSSSNINSAFVLYEDRNDDRQLTLNTIYNSQIDKHISVTGKLEYKRLKSHNYAKTLNLLGGSGYLDINNFADTAAKRQNDLQNPNRVVGIGEKFKYNFNLNAAIINAFAQIQFTYYKVDFYTAINLLKTDYQREGFYKNGRFEDNSLGNSNPLNFLDYQLKTGGTYKINGHHLIEAHLGYFTQAPTIRNSFSNVRENNNVVANLMSEKIISADVSYIKRGNILTTKLTGYYTYIKDATEISFYFGDGIGGDNTAFVQEILSGIEKQHVGLELGVEAQITPAFKLNGAASIGSFTYANNPNLYLNSDITNEGIFDENGRSKDDVSNLKNYKIAAGPHNAISVGFEYRDPNYWWFGASLNFFSNTYIDVAPLTRSSNFYKDIDGLTFPDYNLETAKTLLQQEKFNNYNVLNIVGGKSWKVNKYYISFFGTVNNLLNTIYKSGGFEQGRNANYYQLKADKEKDNPIFGNKYWYGRGTTYFVNVNLSF
nr:TonB-dependent receptor [uncultured Polaribacter sp.]